MILSKITLGIRDFQLSVIRKSFP